jgi:threonine dehydratase
MTWKTPTFIDVLRARRQISPFLKATALLTYPSLDELTGCHLLVKHENHLPTGAFKVRGGINLISQLAADEARRGVISASTGNHGQSIAYGARLFGVRSIICVPERPNPAKLESMKNLGAEILVGGGDFDEAREHCERLAAKEGYRYIHSGNEPLLIAGVATASLEVLEEQPETEVLLVPVGGGSGAAGACIVAKSLNPVIAVIGVQSEGAPAAYRSWKARQLVEDKMNTWAEGLQTRTAFELPQKILWDKLDDLVLVSDEQIRQATRLMIEKTRNLVEGAAAAPLAAALKLKDRLAGKRVALICSGGNLSLEQLRELLNR